MRLAIMQPYMWSAWGYYRLFAAADMFIIYDDCQYMKHGWVNRNRFTNAKGEQAWFTLPLKKAPLETKIMEMQWAENHVERIEKEMKKYPIFKKLGISFPWWKGTPHAPDTPLEAIQNSMLWVLSECGMWGDAKMLASSQLELPSRVRGQEKVIEICKYFRANEYINLSGGKDLYDKKSFEEWGIDLQFLPEVVDKTNILERIAQVGAEQVEKDIYANI